MAPFDLENGRRTAIALAALQGNSTDRSDGRSDPAKPRVVLADDNRRMHEAVAGVLRTKCAVEVVGYALDGAEAIDAVIRLQPDILILDVMMPVRDGIQVARMLKRVDSPTRIIFLTGISDSSFQRAAMEAGGQAYVFKNQMLTDLPCAITAVMTGATFLSSRKL